MVVGAIGSFADSARKLVSSIAEVIGAAQGPSPHEVASQATVRRAAQVVGAYYSRALGEQILDHRSPTGEEIQGLEAALRDMAVVFNAQRQPEKVKLAERAIELGNKLRRSANVPDYWQHSELKAQRDELASIFLALGVPMPGVEPPRSGVGVK
jgi:hypothetical protein